MFLEAKKDWSESASQARAEKDKAREQYNEATEMGLTQDSFEDWISAYSVSTL